MAIWLSLCAAIFVVAYLLGSFPTGYIAVKQLTGIDIREVGSGSTGATNVLRTLGKGPGAFVLGVDCLKGVLAIALVYAFLNFAATSNLIPKTVDLQLWQPWMVILAGLAAILGHSKSIFLGFTGGKSVATSLGILLAMSWQVGLATLGVFAIVVAISRIVSLSSISGAIAVSILMLVFHQPLPYILFSILGGFYVIIRHRSNIERLLAGTEPKIGQQVVTETEKTENTEQTV
ncbi:glycerol-3-phosphate 1-O-acyltransferase PlsY [Nostoc sp. FACHB-87]|uniref:glycerol-3-phosphate 1-O-acyltransferase PlsY n=1 Tax=Nostocales TaxID=1161 RepID=UPI001689F9AB|nr:MULTISPECIES: glycerol-3-phosphate 1-O-acyltransferase PlsY [Nostocales]MBD2302505.1 glycerol-3-phosphate 1-O-acyltransferase PlsY [Nostoc sp. FACHB-190]MBD2457121.1 glycerol-3-phosphate 1-O-acyltransferase PlsY [Nostoc sp. FACHB-87]MBD2477013.1 glycerol-3-phosphate 1-O-acyltransferase PlsY [Anabaena sp. FACHB-83]MBD2490610.1 glycerol-3-phosphate 1-O-acyltransferase PlsY [Aulosira sp. FACHB-615]